MSELALECNNPPMAARQFAMACMSLSAGVMDGFVMSLCMKWTVSVSLSLFDDLVKQLWTR